MAVVNLVVSSRILVAMMWAIWFWCDCCIYAVISGCEMKLMANVVVHVLADITRS